VAPVIPALTDAGRIFFRQAKDILGRVEYARRLAKQAADGRAGDLSVGTFPSADVRILPALRPLIAEHLPDLRLILHSKYAVDPLAGLQSGALDVAFVRGPLETDGLEGIELLREQLVMVLPSHHALARRKRIPVKSLDDLPCITMERALSPALHDAAATLYRQAKIRMHAVSSADNVLGHLQLVQEGLGFALLPDSISSLLPPGVTFRPLDCDPVPTVSVLVAWKSGNHSRLVRAFVDLARRVSSMPKDAPRLTRRRTKS
jgi:DNA-binding transcriptional LysR family regulator